MARKRAGGADARRGGRRGRTWRPDPVLTAVVVLVVAGLVLLPTFRLHLTPDGVSYLSIANHLAEGRLVESLNGYWSPLWSWLAAPGLLVGIPPLIVAKLTGLLSGVLVLAALDRLLQAFDLSSGSRTVALLGTVPFVLQAGYTWISPDLLVAAPLLLLAERLVSGAWLTGPRAALATGAIAGVAYLAKLYALPVVGVVLLGAILLAVRVDARLALRQGAAALGGLALVVGSWAGILSAVEGEPTVGTAGSVNVGVLSPGSSGSPLLTEGLFAPPHPSSVSAWEDPAGLESPAASGEAPPTVDTGSGGGIAERLTGLVDNVGDNLEMTWDFVLSLWPVALFVLVGLVIALRAPTVRMPRWRTSALLGVAAVWVGGLQLLVAHPRYLWPAALLLVPMLALLLERAPDPMVGMFVGGILLVVWLPASVAEIREHRDHGRSAAVLAEGLEEVGVGPGDHVAADRVWNMSLAACFHVGCRFYGILESPRDGEVAAQELSEHEVAWLLSWDGVPDLLEGTEVGHVDPPRGGRVHVRDVSGIAPPD